MPRYLIVNADDFGMNHSTNEAVFRLFRQGAISSATMLTPAAWFLEAADFVQQNPQVSVGVHLTLTSEWPTYRWGPVTTNAPITSLVDDFGYLPRTVPEVEANAQREQVEVELRNQIEKARAAGLDPSHLDNHMGSVYGLFSGNSFLDIVFQLCQEYRLPFRLPRQIPEHIQRHASPTQNQKFRQAIADAEAVGIQIIDTLQSFPPEARLRQDYQGMQESFLNILRQLPEGINEFYAHPALNDKEMQATTSDSSRRQLEYELLQDDAVWECIKQEGIEVISYKQLRDKQRLTN